ncbi:FMN-binding protein [Brassicibacter mesophilus]|uniref:FMN-binding protein n=1 Tax=Brassicibacter mesophilus TaxID=745119 RepID=UPI003D22C1EB
MIFFKGKRQIIIIVAGILCISLFFGYIQLYSSYDLDDKYENVSRLKQYENRDIIRVYKALNTINENEEIVQIVRVKGYKGTIKLITSIDMDLDEVTDIQILSHNETEAYGGYITEEWFLDRFNNKNADRQLKTVKIIAERPNEIVAVTGATISSEAVVNGVNLSLANYMKMNK